MDKVFKKLIVYTVIYAVIFLVGFKSGSIYNRMMKKSEAQKIIIPEEPEEPEPTHYYIVEKRDYGSYTHVNFTAADENHILIRFLFNENLKPLLRLRDIKIFTEEGKQIY